jgi:hypothetical protein
VIIERTASSARFPDRLRWPICMASISTETSISTKDHQLLRVGRPYGASAPTAHRYAMISRIRRGGKIGRSKTGGSWVDGRGRSCCSDELRVWGSHRDPGSFSFLLPAVRPRTQMAPKGLVLRRTGTFRVREEE